MYKRQEKYDQVIIEIILQSQFTLFNNMFNQILLLVYLKEKIRNYTFYFCEIDFKPELDICRSWNIYRFFFCILQNYFLSFQLQQKKVLVIALCAFSTVHKKCKRNKNNYCLILMAFPNNFRHKNVTNVFFFCPCAMFVPHKAFKFIFGRIISIVDSEAKF